MSQIAREYFLSNPLIDTSIVALFLFLGVFLAVSIAAVRAERAKIDRLSRLPFEGEGQ